MDGRALVEAESDDVILRLISRSEDVTLGVIDSVGLTLGLTDSVGITLGLTDEVGVTLGVIV
jgi:hypothetical protein